MRQPSPTLGRPPLPISLRSFSPILAATFMPTSRSSSIPRLGFVFRFLSSFFTLEETVVISCWFSKISLSHTRVG